MISEQFLKKKFLKLKCLLTSLPVFMTSISSDLEQYSAIIMEFNNANFSRIDKGQFNIFKLQTFLNTSFVYVLNVCTFLNAQTISVEGEVLVLEEDLVKLKNSFQNSLKEKWIIERWCIKFFYNLTYFCYKKWEIPLLKFILIKSFSSIWQTQLLLEKKILEFSTKKDSLKQKKQKAFKLLDDLQAFSVLTQFLVDEFSLEKDKTEDFPITL
jgi:hypothetical protein